MLLFSDLGSSRSPGQVAAIGIAFAVLASLVFLPNLTHLPGRTSYCPGVPRFDPDRTARRHHRHRSGHPDHHTTRQGP
ncbi:MMPL family transporter [Arachnia propionica]